MVSKSGHAARFNEKLARPMGRGTAGVKGMNVADKGNEVLSLDVARKQDELLVVTENGYGKRTPMAEYPVKGRGTKGVVTAKLTAKKGGLAGARTVREGQELLFISQSGMVQRTAVSGISQQGRPTQGVRVMNLKKGDRVSAVALVVESDENGNGRSATAAPVEAEAPTAESVADEAAAAEAAGNGEAKVTKAKPAKVTKAKAARPKAAKASPKRSGSKAPSSTRKPATKTKAKPATSPAKKRAAAKAAPASRSKPKATSASASRPKVKPKHTATAKQRAESAAQKKRKR
jgi:hypothetical protein